MTRKIVLASKNEGKVRELAALLAEIDLVSMREYLPARFDVDETGETFSDNAWLKASAVCRATGLPALADDSGLEVDALGGRPGVHSARYAGIGATDEQNNARLLEELKSVPAQQRTARFVCVLVLATLVDGKVRRVAESRGIIEGRVLSAPRGSGGFGYDPLFEPSELPGRTTAEISPAEKNGMSHRGQAARALVVPLRSWLQRESDVRRERE